MRTGESINYLAEGDITAYRIIKFGAADGGILVASAATDLLIGGNGRIPAKAGDQIDVVRDDFIEIQLGGTVTRGERLTSDAQGRAIKAAPAPGANAQIIGIAEASGVVDDIIWVGIAPSVMQG